MDTISNEKRGTSRAGNGICHQVNLERFSIPGETLLGADSHTTSAGGVGMLAIGAGIFQAAAEPPKPISTWSVRKRRRFRPSMVN